MARGEWGSETRTAEAANNAGVVKQISTVRNWGLFPLGTSCSQCRTCPSESPQPQGRNWHIHVPASIRHWLQEELIV